MHASPSRTDAPTTRDRASRALALARTLGALLPTTFALALGSIALGAQSLTLKRALAGADEPCAPSPALAPAAVAPTTSAASLDGSADDAEARRLATAGYEAEILGDFRAARDAFARAAERLPRDDRIAYHLARAHEALEEYDAAASAYCVTLALAPKGANAADSRLRLRALDASGKIAESGPSARDRAAFAAAVSAVDARALGQAEDAFTRLVRDAPSLAEGWYDRAVVRLALGARADAAHDLERYLELRPDAADAASVRARVAMLHQPSFSPSAALVQGLIVPGLGQIYTRRPVRGLMVLIAAGGATAWALDTRDEIRARELVDTRGRRYPGYEVVRVRPYLARGLALAGATAAGAAVESWYYASRSSRRSRAVGITLGPEPTSRALTLRITIPR